jgi:peptidyl-prolyl cis-trans isomerase A (cyclophilin A)
MATVKIIIVLSITLLLSIPGAALSTTVRMQTNLGTFDVELFDDDAPQTVANFLNYVNSGAYNNSFFHRSVNTLSEEDFVIQGGGFSWTGSGYRSIPTDGPVINEFSLDRPNLRGTISMARTSDLNSATSQWFFNLKDNSGDLDNPGNGYSVFGQIKESGLEIMDAIGELQVVNAGGVFSDLPLVSFPPQGQTLQSENLVLINSVEVLPTIATSPNAPTLFYDVDGLNVNISWTEVPDASGYELYYAPYPYVGPETIGNHDVGDQTSKSFYLWRGAAYYIAVTAYNDAGESVYSNIEHFTMTPVP